MVPFTFPFLPYSSPVQAWVLLPLPYSLHPGWGNEAGQMGHCPVIHGDARPAEETDPRRGMPGRTGHLTCALEPARAVGSNCEH